MDVSIYYIVENGNCSLQQANLTILISCGAGKGKFGLRDYKIVGKIPINIRAGGFVQLIVTRSNDISILSIPNLPYITSISHNFLRLQYYND
jgi:hypothetical protein